MNLDPANDPTLHSHQTPKDDSLNRSFGVLDGASFKALNLEIQELVLKLRDTLRREGNVSFAWSLTDLDLVIAGLNGSSEHTNYIVPPPPCEAWTSNVSLVKELVRSGAMRGSLLIVSSSENFVFFQHCVEAGLFTGKISKEQVPDLLNVGFLSVDSKVYYEYLNILQETARAFERQKDLYLEDISSLTAASNFRALCVGSEPLGTLPPLLSIKGPDPQGIIMSVMNLPTGILQRLAPGSTVLLPGAGYNILRDLPSIMASTRYNFVINDQDPFVKSVLEKMVTRYGQTNLSFRGGDMKDLPFAKLSLDAVVISHVYTAAPESSDIFLDRLHGALKIGSPLLLCHPCEVDREVASVHSTWKALLQKHGYRIEAEKKISGRSQSIIPGDDQSLILKMNGEELIKWLKVRPTEKSEKKYGFLIARKVS